MKSSLNGEDFPPKSTFGYGYKSKSESENSFIEIEAKGVEDNFEDEALTIILGLFNGFLTIGTVGFELVISEQLTPTFTMAWDSIANEKNDMTENSLKFFNDELDKFLEVGA
ncbi:hypothetical protein PVK06_030268 [Gossypium arboreum]|uniref:Uncharacterized protein n=1 Tax=Gossypium arboreum TaxID=29729 RepID=A0ABR0NQ98_GOSAR|nr:hypothetical protein PVK06_030268 [Gossypium arboreum]